MSQCHNDKSRRRGDGFTLVEVLVAFVIAAIGLQLAFESFSTHTRLLDQGVRERRAVALAELLLARIGTEIPLRPGTTTGRFDRDHRWRLMIVPLPRGDPAAPRVVMPYDITLVVAWPGWLSEQSVQLHTVKLAPPPPSAQ